MAHKKIMGIKIYLDDIADKSTYEDDHGRFIVAHINAGKDGGNGIYITQLFTREYLNGFDKPPKNIIGTGKAEGDFNFFIKRHMGDDFFDYIEVKVNTENL